MKITFPFCSAKQAQWDNVIVRDLLLQQPNVSQWKKKKKKVIKVENWSPKPGGRNTHFDLMHSLMPAISKCEEKVWSLSILLVRFC